MKDRIKSLSQQKEIGFVGWEFDGGKVEANTEANRLQIFFEDKPDEATREALKSNGFRWSPKAGAWQRQLTSNAYYAADYIKAIAPLTGEKPTELQRAHIRAQKVAAQEQPVQEQPEQEKALIPDDLETGETVKTPRGTFYVTAMSREQMEAAGYGLHHQSDDGKYLIMGNGTRAFAVPVQPENYLKATEQTTEQNYNMIDGQINNTPTTAELEAKVKAGETISLVDLAEAVKADKERGKAAKTEKKPSIRAQLRADKEKTAQKKATKSKNHELEV